MDYDELLKRAMEQKPESVSKDSRFELVKPDVLNIGNKTIIRNFSEIAKNMRRDEAHVAKFLSKELAAPNTIEAGKLVINGKMLPSIIEKKLNEYAHEFVFCPQCGKPDTKIIKVGGYLFLKCEACGSKKPLRQLK